MAKRTPRTPMEIAQGIAESETQRVSAAGRSVDKVSITDLIALRKQQRLEEATKNPKSSMFRVKNTPKNPRF